MVRKPVVVAGTSPVILGFPHTGLDLPEAILNRLNDEGRKLRDTDWHLDRLYAGLSTSVTTIKATTHRYVIDVNRDPAGGSLYPGQNTTTLVPLINFDNQPIWRSGQEPGPDEVAERIQSYHQPYHAAFRAEIERVLALHGIAIVLDCHSIRSVIPFLFEGTLPDFNIGTDNGVTCAAGIEAAIDDIARAAPGYTSVLNGRFRGGWTTRHYGRPQTGVHAIQLEMAQSAYLASQDLPFAFDTGRAAAMRPYLDAMLAALERLALSGKIEGVQP